MTRNCDAGIVLNLLLGQAKLHIMIKQGEYLFRLAGGYGTGFPALYYEKLGEILNMRLVKMFPLKELVNSLSKECRRPRLGCFIGRANDIFHVLCGGHGYVS